MAKQVPQGAEHAAPDSSTQYRILLLDDDKDFTDYQTILLEGQDYAVRVAHTIQDALQQQKDFEPHIALIDLKLKDESGIDALDALLKENHDLCCMILTGSENIESALLALRHGAIDYLSKSGSHDVLMAAIERASEKVQLRDINQQITQTLKQRNEELLKVNRRLEEEISSRIEAENSANDAMKELARVNAGLHDTQDGLQEKIRQQSDEIHFGETKYNLLSDNAADGIFIHDEKGHIFDINKTGRTNLGYGKGDLEQLTIFDIEVGATADELLSVWNNTEPGKSVTVNGLQQRKDRSRFPVEVLITAFYQDNIKYLIAIARDVTERKAAEDALRQSEIKLRSIIESAQEGILVVDGSGRVMHTNHQFQAMWNIPQELIDAGDDEAVLKCGTSQLEDPESFYQLVQDIYASDREATDTLRFKDGRIFERYTRPLQRVAGQELDGRIWVFQDITERVLAEEDLQLYRLMVESTSDPMFVIDSESSRMIYVNEAAVKHYKAPREEILTWRIPDWDPSFSEEDLAPHVEDIKHQPGMLLETVHKTKTGEMVPVEVSLNLTEYKGRTCHFGFFHNIAERKQKEQELIDAKREADYANKAKSEFLTRMSHELRTPMNAILGFGQLLELDNNKLNEEQKAGIGHIMVAGRHLLHLINEVLDIAKVDAGKMSISIENVAFSDVIESALLMVNPLAIKYGVTIHAIENTSCCTLKGDLQRLKQVFVNLLSNAVKYNRKGGDVRLSYHRVAEHNNDKNIAMMYIAITDTGVGIKQEDQRKVFEPFQRLSLRGENIEGSGIGLTITRKMVELMGGNIGFESEYGKGSTFWVELPLADDCAIVEEKGSTEKAELEHRASGQKTILYIEDNPANTTLVETILKKYSNYTLLTATNAEAGIDVAKEQLPDIILMDVDLPGMSGIEAMKVLSEDNSTALIPVIAVSAHALPEHIAKGEKAGFRQYITKPIDVSELLAVIEKE
ncbi:MAG: response regulator [Gammaproteobacteria bacterium]|nr:response regulator [Gammaproteobacteria bacterium]